MKTFKPVVKPFEGDFYSIHEEHGKKYIHVDGYTYKSSNSEYSTEDNPDGIYWANLQVCWFIYELSEFIANYKERGTEWVNENYEGLKQYQADFTDEEMLDAINHYFDNKTPDAYLDFSELTEDTPCGTYVCLSY